jgi:hypothetical protein
MMNSQILELGGEKFEINEGENFVAVDFSQAGSREINLRKGSSLKLLRFVNSGCGEDLKFSVAEGAKLDVYAFVFADIDGDFSIASKVLAENAVSNLNLVYFPEERIKANFRVRNDFLEKNSSGFITVKGVVADGADVTVSGEIGINQKAGNTDSFLGQHALISGKGSRVRQMPILEIDTNEVKAAHGATVAKIQDEDLFYFLARGIDRSDAVKLYVNAFFGDLISEVDGFEDFGQRVRFGLDARIFGLKFLAN